MKQLDLNARPLLTTLIFIFFCATTVRCEEELEVSKRFFGGGNNGWMNLVSGYIPEIGGGNNFGNNGGFGNFLGGNQNGFVGFGNGFGTRGGLDSLPFGLLNMGPDQLQSIMNLLLGSGVLNNLNLGPIMDIIGGGGGSNFGGGFFSGFQKRQDIDYSGLDLAGLANMASMFGLMGDNNQLDAQTGFDFLDMFAGGAGSSIGDLMNLIEVANALGLLDGTLGDLGGLGGAWDMISMFNGGEGMDIQRLIELLQQLLGGDIGGRAEPICPGRRPSDHLRQTNGELVTCWQTYECNRGNNNQNGVGRAYECVNSADTDFRDKICCPRDDLPREEDECPAGKEGEIDSRTRRTRTCDRRGNDCQSGYTCERAGRTFGYVCCKPSGQSSADQCESDDEKPEMVRRNNWSNQLVPKECNSADDCGFPYSCSVTKAWSMKQICCGPRGPTCADSRLEPQSSRFGNGPQTCQRDYDCQSGYTCTDTADRNNRDRICCGRPTLQCADRNLEPQSSRFGDVVDTCQRDYDCQSGYTCTDTADRNNRDRICCGRSMPQCANSRLEPQTSRFGNGAETCQRDYDCQSGYTCTDTADRNNRDRICCGTPMQQCADRSLEPQTSRFGDGAETCQRDYDCQSGYTCTDTADRNNRDRICCGRPMQQCADRSLEPQTSRFGNGVETCQRDYDCQSGYTCTDTADRNNRDRICCGRLMPQCADSRLEPQTSRFGNGAETCERDYDCQSGYTCTDTADRNSRDRICCGRSSNNRDTCPNGDQPTSTNQCFQDRDCPTGSECVQSSNGGSRVCCPSICSNEGVPEMDRYNEIVTCRSESSSESLRVCSRGYSCVRANPPRYSTIVCCSNDDQRDDRIEDSCPTGSQLERLLNNDPVSCNGGDHDECGINSQCLPVVDNVGGNMITGAPTDVCCTGVTPQLHQCRNGGDPYLDMTGRAQRCFATRDCEPNYECVENNAPSGSESFMICCYTDDYYNNNDPDFSDARASQCRNGGESEKDYNNPNQGVSCQTAQDCWLWGAECEPNALPTGEAFNICCVPDDYDPWDDEQWSENGSVDELGSVDVLPSSSDGKRYCPNGNEADINGAQRIRPCSEAKDCYSEKIFECVDGGCCRRPGM